MARGTRVQNAVCHETSDEAVVVHKLVSDEGEKIPSHLMLIPLLRTGGPIWNFPHARCTMPGGGRFEENFKVLKYVEACRS
jgi:hypothetical protein